MKTLVLAFAALALTGCASARYTPEQQLQLLHGMQQAGCGGSFVADVGGETGQLGGGAHASLHIDAECPKGLPAQ